MKAITSIFVKCLDFSHNLLIETLSQNAEIKAAYRSLGFSFSISKLVL